MQLWLLAGIPATSFIVALSGALMPGPLLPVTVVGVGLLKAPRHGHLELDAKSETGMHPVLAGVLMSAANPYWLIWWLTIGLGYVMFSMKYGWLGVALFFIGHILADFAWYTLVSGAVAQGRRFISDRLYQGFLAGCGVFLFGFGGY